MTTTSSASGGVSSAHTVPALSPLHACTLLTAACALCVCCRCVYELAAYTAHDLKHDGSNLVFLPLRKVPTIFFISVGLVLWNVGEYFAQLANAGAIGSGVWPVPIGPIVQTAMFAFMAASILQSAWQRTHLLETMSGFSVAKGKVFAEADRALIEGAIKGWYGGDADSISRFEAEVHGGKVHAAVESLLGANRSGLSVSDMLPHLSRRRRIRAAQPAQHGNGPHGLLCDVPRLQLHARLHCRRHRAVHEAAAKVRLPGLGRAGGAGAVWPDRWDGMWRGHRALLDHIRVR